MADILSAHGLELPVIEEDIQRRLMAMLPSYASALNPIDATAQAIGEVGYAPMLDLVLQSERIDTVLLISSLANESRAKKMAEELAPITAVAKKPILMTTYTTATPAAIATLARAGIACYTSMPSCARAIKALVDYGSFRERLARRAAEAEDHRAGFGLVQYVGRLDLERDLAADPGRRRDRVVLALGQRFRRQRDTVAGEQGFRAVLGQDRAGQ